VHGDWASRDDDGYWYLHGRSDDTLNIAGKRIGPAEVESVVAMHPAVAECAAVAVPDPVKGETIWVVLVPKPNDQLDDVDGQVRSLVREHLGGSFMPARVVIAAALPKTRSAKIVRRAVRAAVTGEDPGDISTLEDPSAIDAIRVAAART
jgi:acetyl-CoA synthetase